MPADRTSRAGLASSLGKCWSQETKLTS